jgi:molybdopterin synthase catalytic subunit/molybdopterin converting factor small subunit
MQVLFFGAARERAGVGEVAIELPPDATLEHAIALISQRFPGVVPLLPYLRFAVNEAFERDLTRPLGAGDVVALIPPVAGGAPRVALLHTPLEPREVEALVAGPDCGGVVTFLGAVRDHTGPHRVTGLVYEAYEPMALKVMEALSAEVEAAFPPVRIACHHRLGALALGDLAVVVVAAAPHRATAFAACQRYIDRLKEDVPIFKREAREDGSVWVGLGP